MTPAESPAQAACPSALDWLGFLSDEMRTCETSEMSLRRIGALLDKPVGDTQGTFVAANLAGLLLFRGRRLSQARELCGAMVDYALAHRNGDRWPELAALALQPEINLMRIDGYAGSLDAALEVLGQLDRLAEGRPARFSRLVLDEPAIAAIGGTGFDLRRFARNVLVVETCKILWRRAKTDELRRSCGHFRRRWPRLMATGGPAHASEGPWLLGDDERAAVAEARSGAPVWQRRAAHVRRLHAAAHAARAGETGRAAELAARLSTGRHDLRGSYASALTPIRWDASLADTLIRAGRPEQARSLVSELLGRLSYFHDPVLKDGLALRARLLGIQVPDDQAHCDRAGPELDASLGRLLGRLGAGSC